MQKKPIIHCLVSLVVFASTAAAGELSPNIMNPDALVPGRDYELIQAPDAAKKAKKLEVIEAFSYACPHCNDFEPMLQAWRQKLSPDVTLKRLPVVFGRQAWRLLAAAYYTGEALGLSEKVGPALFKALHVDHRNLNDEAAVAEVFVEQGAKREQVLSKLRSSETAKQVSAAEQTVTSYKVSGVPTMIVAGKYQTSGSLAGDYQRMLTIVDQLVDQERTAK